MRTTTAHTTIFGLGCQVAHVRTSNPRTSTSLGHSLGTTVSATRRRQRQRRPESVTIASPKPFSIFNAFTRSSTSTTSMAVAARSHVITASVGRLHQSTTCLFVCDIQEKFKDLIFGMPSVIDTTSKVVRSCKVLRLPIFVTEQYPLKLGHTVKELKKDILGSPCISKTKFSMYTPELEKALEKEHDKRMAKSERNGDEDFGPIKQVLLCGIETHVCIMQTAIDLLERGYEVHVVVDGVSSQRPEDRTVALQRLAHMGCHLCTSEMAIFQLCEDSKHPQFRQISTIAKEERTQPILSML